MTKTFKVSKGQDKKPKEDRFIDVKEVRIVRGVATLKHMKAVEKAVAKNLEEIRRDIKSAEDCL